MIFRESMVISKKEADFIKQAMEVAPQDENDMIMGEDDTISNTIKFSNGYEMDIKCCGVRFEEDSCNTAWAEAVLFDENGCQVAYSDVEDEYFGEWKLEDDNGTIYVGEISFQQ